MKDVISVEEILDELALNITIKKSYPLDEADEAHNKLYSLLISKLPEKKTGTIKLGSYSESDIDQIEKDTAIVITYRQGYNSAIDDMRKSIDELFGVQK